jgi:hypothetical protein
MAFELAPKVGKPKNVLVDRNNRFVRYLKEEESMKVDGC